LYDETKKDPFSKVDLFKLGQHFKVSLAKKNILNIFFYFVALKLKINSKEKTLN